METKKLNAFQYFLLAFKRYAVFKGKSTRKEFWYFLLMHIIVVLISNLINNIVGIIYIIISITPLIAIIIRRLRDAGISWVYVFLLIGIFPVVFFGLFGLLMIGVDEGFGFIIALTVSLFTSAVISVPIFIAFLGRKTKTDLEINFHSLEKDFPKNPTDTTLSTQAETSAEPQNQIPQNPTV